MLFIEWSLASGWEKPHIKPLENLSVHPAISAFHYAVEVSTTVGQKASSSVTFVGFIALVSLFLGRGPGSVVVHLYADSPEFNLRLLQFKDQVRVM